MSPLSKFLFTFFIIIGCVPDDYGQAHYVLPGLKAKSSAILIEWRKIFIFDCATKAEVQNFISEHIEVAADLFAVDLVPWYTESSGSFIHGKPKNPVDVDNK